ncbi:hypothetical protein QUV83_16520 [Cellulomonas cellasea]|uniref:FtsX-like permease family protein n=1 Tax=Cellulomonas cellasea TaxID=43670 RepID=UPI0025A411D3|nr:FtsX-like permease family protein [Cellulomonas cellasea]MDM8086379.1 hypothetical protein [Cellulomonas cellasea]
MALAPVLLRAGGASGVRQQARSTALAVLAFAITTALALSVLGGQRAFTVRAANGDPFQKEWGDLYIVLAWVAVILLMVPLLSLGGAAARLGVARRDARLATLRLLGATPREVVALTVTETAWQGLIGAAFGMVGYVLLLPVWTLVPFQGGHLAIGELWVGPLMLVALLVAPALAAVSAAFTLRRVVVSPLGVAQRTTPAGLKVIRLIVAVVAVIGFLVVTTLSGLDSAALTVLILGMLAAVFGSINLVGPWLIWLLGKIAGGTARSAAGLLAARRLADDPKAAWRVVGGLGLASFVAAVLSVLPMISEVQGMAPGERLFLDDLVMGAMLTLAITFVVAACSAGIIQAASVLDRRRDYALQALAGAPASLLDGVRRREVLVPLIFVSVTSAGMGLLVIMPFLGPGVQIGTPGLLMLGGCLVAGCLLVLAASEASRPLLRTVLRETSVRPD